MCHLSILQTVQADLVSLLQLLLLSLQGSLCLLESCYQPLLHADNGLCGCHDHDTKYASVAYVRVMTILRVQYWHKEEACSSYSGHASISHCLCEQQYYLVGLPVQAGKVWRSICTCQVLRVYLTGITASADFTSVHREPTR